MMVKGKNTRIIVAPLVQLSFVFVFLFHTMNVNLRKRYLNIDKELDVQFNFIAKIHGYND